MDDPRPDKVAVVEEVRGRLEGAQATILTEYRGLTVAELAQLRHALASVGGDYKVYKNTLVRLAVAGGRHEPLTDLLSGPTAIAFVSGEISAVAKALRDFSRTYPALVLKGGQHGDGVLSPADLVVLADLPSREVLLARVAGALAAPMQQLAGLLQALPRNLAYGLSALLEERGGAPPPDVTDAPAADKKIQVIKEVRALTSLGLKEAKDLVDGAPAPDVTDAPAAEASAEEPAADAAAEEPAAEAAPTETAEAAATETAEAAPTETAEAASTETAEAASTETAPEEPAAEAADGAEGE